MNCPHCQTVNPEGAEFCGTCGKALPLATTGPRVVSGTADLADTAAGQQLQSEELVAKAKTARRTLMAVAVLMTLGIAVVFAQASKFKTEADTAVNNPQFSSDNPANRAEAERIKILIKDTEKTFSILVVVQTMLAFSYFGLYFWARSNPLPAAITGLVIYVTLMLVLAAIEPTTLAQGWLIKLLIIIGLGKAIEAGLAHRELLKKMNPHLAV